MASSSSQSRRRIFNDGAGTLEEYRMGSHSDPDQGSRDQAELARLGKAPIIQRKFGFMAILGFSCTVLITWEAVPVGGFAGFVYTYVLVWAGTWAVFASICELASMAPVSGGQYYWVNFLAPRSSQHFLSYITGWLTLCGWQAAVAEGCYICSSIIQGLVVLGNPDYEPKPWQGLLVFWAVLALVVAVNTLGRYVLPRFESLLLVVHIIGFFALLLPMVILAPEKQSAEVVFTKFQNLGGWPTQGLSFMIGILGAVYAFIGADAAVHMSEEIKGASLVVPRSVMLSMFLNGATGFGMLMALLFCIGDVDEALNSPTGYPFMTIFVQATQSVHGAQAMAAIICVAQIAATVGACASGSRMLWAFSRDRAVPGWRFFQVINQRTSIPLRCVGLTSLVAILLSFITLGSTVAFNNLVSLVDISLFSSYLMVVSLLLWRRVTGAIGPYNPSADHLVNAKGAPMMWGPWRIVPPVGTFINAFAVAFATVVVLFIVWPPIYPVTPANMNYAVLVWGAVLIAAMLYYVTFAHKEFRGPVRDLGS